MRLLFSIALLVLVLGQSALSAAQDSALKPFATDGCSLWIDGTPQDRYMWRHCCVAHDKDYWLGGTEEQRKASDKRLLACVSERAGKGMGEYMYVLVGFGGSPVWVTPYRWGYGWSYLENGQPRGYKIPTAGEQQQIDILLPIAEKTIAEDAIAHPPKNPPTPLLVQQPEKALQ